MLLNSINTDHYERQGHALTNFKRTLPEEASDLAQELTKDPYDFAFTGITGKHNEKLLKDKLLDNITQFLVELGTGFAYMGREYRLKIGELPPPSSPLSTLFAAHHSAANTMSKRNLRRNSSIGTLAH